MPPGDRSEKSFPTVRSVFAGVAEWWRSRGHGYADDYEDARIARELGIGVGELHELVRRGRNSANLLTRRMAALHLDANALARSDGVLLRDLQRVCAVCESKGRCLRDLDRDPNDPAWEDYCPNEGPLNALRACASSGEATS